jgi:pimeloyl-ACP methyl ester carboxylesterase
MPVVLLHGIAASLHDWDALMPALAAAGRRAVAVDLLGHGESPHLTDPEQFNLREVYNSFETWLDGLELAPPYHLVGHSLGGYLSIRYALRQPEHVCSLTLVNPLYCVAQIAPALRAFRRRPEMGSRLIRLAPAWLIDRALAWDSANPDVFSQEARRQIALDYKRASPHFLNITRRIPDLTPELGKLHMPVLLLWGDQDRTLNPVYFARMVARLPHASHHRLRGSGHQPHIGKAGEVNRLVLSWLAQFENQGASRKVSVRAKQQ